MDSNFDHIEQKRQRMAERAAQEEADRLAIIEGLADGPIDLIATDHAPHTLEDKTKGTWESSPGIPNLETVVPLLLTEVNNGNIDLKIIPKILFSLQKFPIFSKSSNLPVAVEQAPTTIAKTFFPFATVSA